MRTILHGMGHQVFTPTLTGLGDRQHLLRRDIDLKTHVEDVLNLLKWEELDDAVLVGHSYGGLVAGHVADQVPESLSHLVYLDALIPEDGTCLLDQIPDLAPVFLQQVEEQGDGWMLPPLPAAAISASAADFDWIDRRCTVHPFASYLTKADLQNRHGTVPSTYIMAKDFPSSPFRVFAEKARAMGWPCHELSGGHDLMVDNPEEVCRVLANLAS